MIRLVERFSRITIQSNGLHQRSMEVHYDCPHCGSAESYMVYSPQTCGACMGPLPEFDNIRDTLIARIMWHFGDKVDDMIIVV